MCRRLCRRAPSLLSHTAPLRHSPSDHHPPVALLRAACCARAAGVITRAVLVSAANMRLKLGEHTWGKDVKKNLLDNYDWLNEDFERAKAAGGANAS